METSSQELCPSSIMFHLYRCGRCKLENVKILNDGIDWNSGDNLYWKHDVQRFEALKVILHGNAEFEATDVVIQVSLVVPSNIIDMDVLSFMSLK